MKPASRLPGRQHPQIWNSAAQLADIPIISTQTLIPAGARAVILSPHPGDEIGACGGLLQLLNNLDQPMLLISVSDGALIHPGSPLWTDERLRTHRPHPQESVDALHRLGIATHGLQWVRGGFPERTLAEHEAELTDFIARHLRPGDVVFSTWRQDGDSDHDTVGRAGALAADRIGVAFNELPVWAWHWPVREQNKIPWHRARKLRLDVWTTARKRHAMHAYVSQLNGEPASGIAPLVPRVILDRMGLPYEIVFI
ncbi:MULTISPECIES: PIG-L deacetylase family protein [Pseudomonas]|uniref:PIG-L deacetylase family protein n=1 Tax=Pseudomonas TaxID=286 RepID=UPI0007098CC5|nr:MULTISPECIES: PIG-L family deacetylase [Pseudomonas]KQW28302.1 acetylglucosaminylphosphatidylinositol deacetylase [Pseudomonas sp. Root401]WHS56329.1 PIG-L family deacetylase [Pseudomonas brassicacearum]